MVLIIVLKLTVGHDRAGLAGDTEVRVAPSVWQVAADARCQGTAVQVHGRRLQPRVVLGVVYLGEPDRYITCCSLSLISPM